MNKYLIVFLIILIGGCKQKKEEHRINVSQEIENENIEVLPIDSTINLILQLKNPQSFLDFYHPKEKLVYVESLRFGSPLYVFLDRKNVEYLLTYRFEGDVENSISCFEVGFLEDEDFKSESGIHLDLTLDSLILKKGHNYSLSLNNNDTIISYKTDVEHSEFVKRYSMATYIMEYTIRNNKIRKMYFGFEYP
jgi:hypothetical protein